MKRAAGPRKGIFRRATNAVTGMSPINRPNSGINSKRILLPGHTSAFTPCLTGPNSIYGSISTGKIFRLFLSILIREKANGTVRSDAIPARFPFNQKRRILRTLLPNSKPENSPMWRNAPAALRTRKTAAVLKPSGGKGTCEASMTRDSKEQKMNIVIVGHVDHGKSTVIGRLLADTGSLPKGKLEQVQAECRKNAKPFEYAFLLDALKDEQAQGITIDTARCFFKSKKREYIIIDAPGHIEFLKNMITGAARAEAAMLVIDAHEGIRENSKRHGYMMSFLGIKNINICVNKMDLVNYSEEVFVRIKEEYTNFLSEINTVPTHFIPISALKGENMAAPSKKIPWYKGPSVLEAVDGFKKAAPKHQLEFRFPVQDIYKFTAEGDERRIMAGRVESDRKST